MRILLLAVAELVPVLQPASNTAADANATTPIAARRIEGLLRVERELNGIFFIAGLLESIWR
jgi:hypothetical protein